MELANIGFEGLTPAQVLAIGDGLMRIGSYSEAAHAYAVALREPAARTGANLSRYGLARNPTSATPAMFRALLELETLGGNAFVGAGLATWFKPLHFFADQRFHALANKHSSLLAQPNWHWNLSTVLWAVREALEVDGDFVELGVFKGHTTLFCADYIEFADQPKTWWLYDTFEGVPDDQLDAGWAEINANLYRDAFTLEEVAERFSGFPNVRVTQGRVPEILSDSAPDRIAFLHLDLNNTIAEIQALDWTLDRLSPGGIIVLDDYGWQASSAQRVAEEAWFAKRGVRPLALPTGQGIYRKP